ncbi:hypothetical protein, partial [Methylocapsa sp. S129]|uniref:hypothetical protein n=1 Tax=Methylocapsa sp. S129 TaxID=1641869 RepID=UPI001AEDDE9E
MLALRKQSAHRFDQSAARVRREGWSPQSAAVGGGDNASLLALAGDALGTRFRFWRGASGQRYIFSTYDQ